MTPAQRPATIFVVDDDAALVESLVELLGYEGYDAEGFTRPLDALARLRGGERPQALLLDFLMPEMSGKDFLDALAEAQVHVPVLLLSGVADPRHAFPTVAAVLAKPFDVERLLAVIHRTLAKTRR